MCVERYLNMEYIENRIRIKALRFFVVVALTNAHTHMWALGVSTWTVNLLDLLVWIYGWREMNDEIIIIINFSSLYTHRIFYGKNILILFQLLNIFSTIIIIYHKSKKKMKKSNKQISTVHYIHDKRKLIFSMIKKPKWFSTFLNPIFTEKKERFYYFQQQKSIMKS